MTTFDAPTPTPTTVVGLTADEVAARRARGQVNEVPAGPTRTVRDIVRSNVVTRFNVLLAVLLAIIVVVAPPQDALFGLVMVVNTTIGIVQEVRAKRTLDRLALLTAPRARVVRDRRTIEIPIDQVVMDDVLALEPGDQIIVDGQVIDARGLEVDESLLTGEADPVPKLPGDGLLSGSFVVAGTATQRATRVGAAAYASRLSAEARQFTMVHSELRAGIDWLLRLISWLLVPTIPLLVYTQLQATPGIRHAIAGAVAGSVAMVPQGLVLLTSVAFAVSVMRLGRRDVLVQELPAVEGLARVDTVCFDKTGTLTEGRLRVLELVTLGRGDAVAALGALADADPAPNTTLRAVANAYPAPEDWEPSETLPFSSARKYAGASFPGHGTWLLGAPEMLLPDHDEVRRRADAHADEGRRVLALVTAARLPTQDDSPSGVRPVALVVLGDAVRTEVVETLRWFTEQRVRAKVISGDHPRTVAAIARQAGVPGADAAMDARDLPDDEEALADALESHVVFGRVSPHQKWAMVTAMQSRGHVVAMTGDGVNDVLALKHADIGVAMGAGSAASRAVAQVVLLESSFDTLPEIVAEGRRVTANIERVANLFLTKTVYAFLIAVATGVAGLVFPFLPRHLTLVGSLTIGIPSFFLALEPTSRRYQPGLVQRVMRFAIPTGAVAAAATFSAYWLARDEQSTLMDSRTIATLVLVGVGIFALVLICRPWTRLRRTVVTAVAIAAVLTFVLPPSQAFFALAFPRAVVLLAGIGIMSLTGAAIYAGLRAFGWLHTVSLADVEELAGEAVVTSRRALQRAADLLRRPRA